MDHWSKNKDCITKTANIRKSIESKKSEVQSAIEIYGTSNYREGKNDSLSIISMTNSSLPTESKEHPGKQDIQTNISINSSYWYCLYAFLMLAVSLLNTMIWTLIPRQNSILNPSYWYETLVIYSIAISPRNAAVTVVELSVFTNFKELLTFTTCMKAYIGWILPTVISYISSYLIWTVYLGGFHPMPFIGLTGYISDFIMLMFFKNLFPAHVRDKKDFKDQAKWYVVYRGWLAVGLTLQLNVLTIASKVIPSTIQFFLAALIPLLRTGNSLIVSRIAKKFPGTDQKMTDVMVTSNVMVSFAYFVATRLPSLNQETVYSIVAVESILHLKHCLQIILLNRKMGTKIANMKNNSLSQKKEELAQGLVINEFIEAIVPLNYGLAFATAFYGANGDIMRNVRNSYFGGEEMKEIDNFFYLMALMFSVDMLATIVTCIVLYLFCRINLFQEFCNAMKKYWMILMIRIPLIVANFAYNDVNAAMDFTFKFTWTAADGRNSLTNATNIEF